MGCPLTRECKQKKNPIFIFKSVRVHLRESVRLRECVNTEFDWELKGGLQKASVSRAVCLRECLLAESWLYFYLGLDSVPLFIGMQKRTIALNKSGH